MADFLEQLQRMTAHNTNHFQVEKVNTDCPEVYFMLDDKEDGVYLSVVDEKRSPVTVDYHYYDSETAQLLHSIENIMRERRFQIVWDEVDQRINLNDHPYLGYQLVRCQHVIDSKGKELICHDENRNSNFHFRVKIRYYLPVLV